MQKIKTPLLLFCIIGWHLLQYEPSVCEYDIAFDQALGYQINETTGEVEPMLTHVANRDSVIVVQSSAGCLYGEAWEQSKIELQYENEHKEYTPQQSMDEAILYPIDHGDVMAGDAIISLQVGDVQQQLDIQIVDTAAFSILLVPLLTSCESGPCVVSGLDEQKKVWHDELMKRFPLAQDELTIAIHDTVDASAAIYDLDTWLGRLRTWSLSKQLHEEGEYDAIIALVPEAMDLNAEKDALTGYTYGSFTTVMMLQGDESAGTMAHEISHFYQIGDEYQGGQLSPLINMPPYLMRGRSIVSPTMVVTGTSPYVLGGKNDSTQGTGTLLQQAQLPYDVITHRLLKQPMTSYMGKDGYPLAQYWTTPPIWNHLIQEWSK